MKFKKGQGKIGGRQKGTPNKLTVEVKLALEEAFTKIGGVEAFAKWARRNPDEFYRLWIRMLPKDLKVTGALGLAEILKKADEEDPT